MQILNVVQNHLPSNLAAGLAAGAPLTLGQQEILSQCLARLVAQRLRASAFVARTGKLNFIPALRQYHYVRVCLLFGVVVDTVGALVDVTVGAIVGITVSANSVGDSIAAVVVAVVVCASPARLRPL